MDWLVPWYSIEHNAAQVTGMEQELQRELTHGHSLYGLPVQAVARRQDCDDVLFRVLDGTGRVAVVHLTWTQNPPDRSPWPYAGTYQSFEDWVQHGMLVDHADFSAADNDDS